jgi:hypothetical protein
VAKKRHHGPCWSDVRQTVALLIRLADEIVLLIRVIHGG